MGFHRYCGRVAFVALGLLAAVPASAQSAVDFKLFFHSQPGDYIGAGETQTYTEADGTVTINSSATTVSVRIAGPSFNFWWDTTFSAPGGVLPGVYNTARRSPFTSFNGLSFSGSGRGCNTLTGRFVVLEAEYGPAGMTKLAVDFEQHCEDAAPGLFGAIRLTPRSIQCRPLAAFILHTTSRFQRRPTAPSPLPEVSTAARRAPHVRRRSARPRP